jgi:UDP-N-acetyl-D-glucosamine dehydrogenase
MRNMMQEIEQQMPSLAGDNVAVSAAARLAARIESRSARLTVIGQGYVGLPLAAEFAHAGFKVTGLETNSVRVDDLNKGVSHTSDVPAELLRSLISANRYRASTDFAVLEKSDVVIVCVPTPLRKSKDPDISFVVAAANEIAAHLQAGQLVILESTTYPGTTEEILLPLFETNGRKVGEDFFLAFSPERIDPANSQFRVCDIPKVVGGITPVCTQIATLLYRQIVGSVTEVSGPKVAEMAKLYENVFRNVNVALANELALMCHRIGVSTREVIDAASTKPFGFLPFHPGPGVGGHCIGIDSNYLAWKMRLNGYDARFIHLAEEINQSMPARVVDMIGEALNRHHRCMNGATVIALGVAYKRGVGDTRESPALEVIRLLQDKGAIVTYADPYVSGITLPDGTLMKSVTLNDAIVEAADCVVILTDHPDFDYARIVLHASLVVDTRNATWKMPTGRTEIVRL